MTIGQFHIIKSDKKVWIYGKKFEAFIGSWPGIQRSIAATGRFAIGALMFRPLFVTRFLVIATNHAKR